MRRRRRLALRARPAAPGLIVIASGAAAAHLPLMRILDVDSVPPREAARLTPHLIEGERIDAAFASSTGALLFTASRILLVQREHLLEEKVETASWPWRAVRHFSVTESAAGGARAALRIWLGDDAHPLHLRANPGTDLAPLQALLAARI